MAKSPNTKTTDTISIQVGYLSSSISNSQGVFNNIPCLVFNFSQTHSSIGLSLEFDEEYPTSLTIKYYDLSGNVLSNETISSNKKNLVYGKSVQNYKKIEIYFNSTLHPYRRARLYSAIFGIIQTYTDEELINLNVTRETSLANENQVPVSTCEFTIDNSDKSFNIINPNGVYEFLQTKQLIKTKVGVYFDDGSVEYVDTGKYYLNEWKSDGTLATLTANDSLSFINAKYSSGSVTKTLYNWAVAILNNANVTNYEIDSSLNNISVTTQFDDMDSKQLLKYIAQASNTMLYVDENDKIVFKPIPASLTDEIDFEMMLKEPKINLNTKTNQVDVYIYQYQVAKEEQTIVSVHNWILGDEVFVEEISDNPFITTNAIATNVANNILSLLANRIIYELNWRQNPVIDINNLVKVEDGFDENKNGVVIKTKMNYKGYLSGESSIKGIN